MSNTNKRETRQSKNPSEQPNVTTVDQPTDKKVELPKTPLKTELSENGSLRHPTVKTFDNTTKKIDMEIEGKEI